MRFLSMNKGRTPRRNPSPPSGNGSYKVTE
jgi:hypothetical protein